MPQNKKHIIHQRREQISDLYLQGFPQYIIAEKVEVTQSQVSKDLKALSQIWQRTSLVNIDKIKAEDLAKIDQLERKYYEGWERSIRVQTTRKKKKTASGGKVSRESAKEKKDLIGNPRFLDGVMKCISKREEILGYGAPQKKSIEANLNIESLTDEQADRLLQEILAKHEINGT